MDIDKLVQRFHDKGKTDAEWIQLEKDMHQFLKEEHSEEEKRKLSPLGWLEPVTIICDGIRRKNRNTSSQ